MVSENNQNVNLRQKIKILTINPADLNRRSIKNACGSDGADFFVSLVS